MKKQIAVVAAAAACLAGCGGGGGGDSSPPPSPTAGVYASASQSVQGFIDYLIALTNIAADSDEPVSIAAVVAPTSESDEPLALH